MNTIVLSNLNPNVIDKLQKLADSHNRSLSDEIKAILEQMTTTTFSVSPDEKISSPTVDDDEFEAVADELVNSIASYQGLNPTVLPDYAFSREGIYQDHP